MLTLRQLTLWLLLSVLTGCATMEQRATTTANWKAHREQLIALTQWTASGKLAVRTRDASESASMVWRQQDQNTQLQLSGPLGVGAMTIESDGKRLDIHQGDEHQTLDISTPDAIYTNTGWDLPLQALSHWLKGLPSPDTSVQHLELDPQTELLHSLTQDDWEVLYETYKQFQDYSLPTRLLIRRGTTRARVIISKWQTESD